MEKSFLMTFDYELFFGIDTGSVSKCLIEPTNELIRIGKKHNAHFTFFVDSLYLLKLKKAAHLSDKLMEEYYLIVNQLKELIDNGHEIGLHLHPHWENSTFENGNWKIDPTKYRLHQFDDADIERFFGESISWFLENLNYKPISFRAGGWCIQPYFKLKNAFKKFDIKIDSTVYKSGFLKNDTHFFDFRTACKLDKWKFETDPLYIESHGTTWEIPMTTFHLNFTEGLDILMQKIKNPTVKFGDGYSIGVGRFNRVKSILRGAYYPLSVDSDKAFIFEKKLNYFINQNKEIICAISHPKALTRKSITILENSIENLNRHNYKIVAMKSAVKLD